MAKGGEQAPRSFLLPQTSRTCGHSAMKAEHLKGRADEAARSGNHGLAAALCVRPRRLPNE